MSIVTLKNLRHRSLLERTSQSTAMQGIRSVRVNIRTRKAPPMFDLLIRNAEVLDGTGSPVFRADISVNSGRIADVGTILADAQSHETVDAAGLTLAPGFIDIHTHADIALLARPDHLPKVMQGVTT